MSNNWDAPDAGMQNADDRLKELENRLTGLYSDASKELTADFREFLSQFETENSEMLDRLARNEIDNDEYVRWFNTRIMQREEFRAKIDSLTNDLVHVDELAVQMINNELPDVYTSSYNFAGYRGEMFADAGGYTYSSFAIYNADAVRIIATENPDLIPWDPPTVNVPKDKRWNRMQLQNAIATGIMKGDTMDELANRLLPVVHYDEVAAMRTARTSYTYAENIGRRDGTQRVRDAGIPMVEPWMALLDTRTRDTHLLLHGTYPNKDGLYGEGIIPSGHLLKCPADPNGDPDQIYNCRCRVNSFLQGVDHTRDDLLYEQMMQDEFYDDWIGDKEHEGVSQYKVDEIREALERKQKLESGEITSREYLAYERRMAREREQMPTYRTATNRNEAMQLLNDLGVTDISKTNIKKIPDELLIATTNRLSELNSRFGAMKNDMFITVKKMRAMATQTVEFPRVSGSGGINWGFKLGDVFYNPAELLEQQRYGMEKNIFMPCSPSMLNVATITHEYGHLVQHSLMYDAEFEADWMAHLGDIRYLRRSLDSRNIIARRQREEIIAIARENNPNFDLNANISSYARTNDFEFFAETFMNSQCGQPNELGVAMQIWLERNVLR